MTKLIQISLAVLFCTCLTQASVIGSASHNRLFNDAGTLIVGGRPALQGEAPYQLSIQLQHGHLCGASLVEVDSLQVGVTAAHCIREFELGEHSLVAGDINFADNTGIEQKLHVDHITVHQNYSDFTVQNDIALLFFNGSFLLNENIQTVPLPVQGQTTARGNLTVSGWGNVEYQGSAPNELQIVSIPLVDHAYCKKAYEDFVNWYPNVTESMICAGRRTGDMVSPCNGDSGGPAISDSGYLAGIVSWGHVCGHPDYPAVFTEVSYFIDWIHNAVADYKINRQLHKNAGK